MTSHWTGHCEGVPSDGRDVPHRADHGGPVDVETGGVVGRARDVGGGAPVRPAVRHTHAADVDVAHHIAVWGDVRTNANSATNQFRCCNVNKINRIPTQSRLNITDFRSFLSAVMY